MKKINNALFFILTIVLYYLSKNSDMILFVISFSLLLLYNKIFSTLNFDVTLSEYYSNKNYYKCNKIFKFIIMFIIIIFIILGCFSYLMEAIFNIPYLGIVNLCMCLFLMSNILVKTINDYLLILGYKKINLFINKYYNFANIVICIINIVLLYAVFDFNDIIKIMLLYLIPCFISLIVVIILFIFAIRRTQKNNYKNENIKMNFFNEIKNVIDSNNYEAISDIIKLSYIYISIIILYFMLLNKFNYDFSTVSDYVTNVYFYSIIVVYFIYLLMKKLYSDDLYNLKKLITLKNNNVEKSFYKLFNKIINLSVFIIILLMIISGPINVILFDSDYNFIFEMLILLLFYILYDFVIEIDVYFIKNKKILIVLLSGLIVKLLFDVPLINAVYRMGYNLSLGSIFSNALGFTVSIIIGIIFIKNKFKLSLLNNFNNILNIIYENIIFCLIMVLFTLVVKVETSTILSSILVILFYLLVAVIYWIIRKQIMKKKV